VGVCSFAGAAHGFPEAVMKVGRLVISGAAIGTIVAWVGIPINLFLAALVPGPSAVGYLLRRRGM
jgi:hypothetical protein